jgi:Uma2 family endonuclease
MARRDGVFAETDNSTRLAVRRNCHAANAPDTKPQFTEPSECLRGGTADGLLIAGQDDANVEGARIVEIMPVEIVRRRFDVDEYIRMAQAGILSEHDRVELINGEVVAMTPVGPRHNAAISRAARAIITAVGDRAIVQNQGSIQLSRFYAPQPDFALLRPRDDFYASHLPGPADIILIIEVAESSLDYDRQVKARIYAEFNVPEYWLVDVGAREVVRHTNPRGSAYETLRVFRSGESIAPERLPDVPIDADVLMVPNF